MSDQSLLRPWQRIEAVMEGMGEEAKTWFRDIQSEGDYLSGLVIACWDDENAERPTHYLAKYRTGRYDWCRFGDEDEEEAPYIFMSLKAALARAVKERQELAKTPRRVGFAMWVHPEASYVPLERYAQMTGVQFPGCPRQ